MSVGITGLADITRHHAARQPDVAAAARARDPGAVDPVSVFAALREWKNVF